MPLTGIWYLILVVSPVCLVDTAGDADRFATSVTEQLQTPVGVLVTAVSREVGHQLTEGQLTSLTTTVVHLVSGQRAYFPVSLTAGVAEMLVAVETVPSHGVYITTQPFH